MRPRFSGPRSLDHSIMQQRIDAAFAAGEAERIATRGEPDFSGPAPIFARRYDIDAAFHNSIETASATAHYTNGRLELWLASQAPEAARAAAAKAVGLPDSDVVLYPMAAGGSFDARLERQHAIEVAQIAREVGHPVQLTWSRREEAMAVPPRTPLALQLAALEHLAGHFAAPAAFEQAVFQTVFIDAEIPLEGRGFVCDLDVIGR